MGVIPCKAAAAVWRKIRHPLKKYYTWAFATALLFNTQISSLFWGNTHGMYLVCNLWECYLCGTEQEILQLEVAPFLKRQSGKSFLKANKVLELRRCWSGLCRLQTVNFKSKIMCRWCGCTKLSQSLTKRLLILFMRFQEYHICSDQTI